MLLSFAAKKFSVAMSFTLNSKCLLGIWAFFLQMGVEETQFANQISKQNCHFPITSIFFIVISGTAKSMDEKNG